MEKRSTIFDADNTYDQNSISYNFNLALHPGKHYEGISEIKFRLADHNFHNNDFFLDFQGTEIDEILVNSRNQNSSMYDKEEGKIYLPKDILKKG